MTRIDNVYLERNRLVAILAGIFPSGIKRTLIEDWDPEWYNCVYIDLPTGQASWHYHDLQAYLFASLPPYEKEWDGHTTEEKHERIERLILQSRLGATGEFSRGKIANDDEGNIRLAIGVRDKTVFVDFGKQVQWVGFPREEALALAAIIVKHAESIK